MCNAEAHDWVDTHRFELPGTYDEISEFSLNYRRAIYSALDVDTKAQLWQEQFQRALRSESLMDAQRELLLEAIELTTPELFSTMKNRRHHGYREAKKQVAEFEIRAREVFGNEEAGALFGRIGPADVEIGIIRPRGQVSQKGLEKAVGCSCSDASDYCSSAFNCGAGGCTTIRDECGTFWTYDCDGQCQLNGVNQTPTN